MKKILLLTMLAISNNTFAQPANDNCSGAVTLTQVASCNPINGTTVNATYSIPSSPCATGSDDDVWYKFVATTSTPVIVVDGNIGFDPVVNLRSGTACNGTSVSCADATYSGGIETIYATGLTVGSNYYVRVYSYGAPVSGGTFTICVYDPNLPPENNDCSDAITLTQASTCNPTNGTTVSSTNSISGTCPGTDDDDVWYKFVATTATPTIKVVSSSSFNAVVDLRLGACTGTNISCADVTASGGTETINATGLSIDSTYYVRVYSYDAIASSSGAFTICIHDACTITSINQNSSICTGDSIFLSGKYQTTDGTYYDTLPSVNGCDSVIATTLTVNPIPSIPTVSANGAVLTSSSTTGNQWYLNDTIISGATSQNYSVTQNGNYTVNVTDSNGCSAISAPYNFTSVGFTELTSENSFIIIPNPSSGKFLLHTDNLQSSKIKIYNVIGKIIYESENRNSEIDLSKHPKGIYSLEIVIQDKSFNKKLIIQ